MPNNAQTTSNRGKHYQELVRKLSERVWQMWQEELRQERERRGIQHRRQNKR
jgi:hypothetical protein